MTDDEAQEQLRVAAEAIRAAVLRLLREGEVHPQILVMAAAQVAGEPGSGGGRPRGRRTASCRRPSSDDHTTLRPG